MPLAMAMQLNLPFDHATRDCISADSVSDTKFMRSIFGFRVLSGSDARDIGIVRFFLPFSTTLFSYNMHYLNRFRIVLFMIMFITRES